jgi:hypothetical protein
MRRNKATRSSSSYPASPVIPAKKDRYSLPDEWERGCTNAGILLVLMFVVLTLVAWWFGW